MIKPKLWVIVGPTAVGKTSKAIEIAQKFKTEIINADSRQVYQELNIGVARPTTEELQMVHHHFIASHSIFNPLTAGQYEREALPLVGAILETYGSAVLVGGSGLYIKALIEGLDDLPKDTSIRNSLALTASEQGWELLEKLVQMKDPEYALSADLKNPRRLIRALEVMEITGLKYSELRKNVLAKRNFEVEWIVMEMDRSTLYQRINDRVEVMIQLGLIEEVRNLLKYRNLEALQTVGYSELFDYFEGKTTLENAIELIKQHSRNYAKRQITWFKHQIKK